VLPDNYIAFELPEADPAWWHDIMETPDFSVKNSHIEVPDTPGLGIRFIEEEAKKYLRDEDADFFDN